MGGEGSGREGWRPKAESMLQLDLRHLHRKGLLEPGVQTIAWPVFDDYRPSVDIQVENEELHLIYRTRHSGSGKWEDVRQVAKIEWTPCHFGGHRPWLRCPACHKRVAILYGSSRFLCRVCHDLVYESQCESVEDRLLRKALKIRKRLGEDGEATKPKWMRWATYHRLLAALWECEQAAFDHFTKRPYPQRQGCP